jgi:DNA polymerase-3 subunit delta'
MLVGHKKQWQFLQGAVKQGRVPHALLFTGESHLGKKTLAIEFIKLLNCQNPCDGKPCQICQNCKEIAKNIYPELTLVQPEEKEKEIRVAQIRALRSRLALRSFDGCFKAVILDNANFLNQEAQSAFLKLLEEPKGKTVFILIAEHPEMLFSTILSRVEILRFYPVADDEIKKELKKRGLSENEIHEIISLSWGKPGRAINLLQNPNHLKDEKQKLAEIIKLSRSDLASRFQYAKKISARPLEIKNILDGWLRYFRRKLLGKISEPRKVASLPRGEQENYSLFQLRKILEAIQRTQFLISSTNINPKLALEIMMLEI